MSVVVLGIAACGVAVLLLVWVAAGASQPRVPRSRLDPHANPAQEQDLGAIGDATALAERLLRRSGHAISAEAVLERAGIRRRPADVLVLVAAAAAVSVVLGGLLGGPLLALAGGLLPPLVAKVVVDGKRNHRQAAFAEQLDDSLHLMASSLRAGHSVLRAVDAVSRDTEAPTSEEFSRVVNETRVGRDVVRALEDVADRTGSEEFGWVVQAIGIHREVGGNLAEVLDRVSATIQERTQIRRHARALSAEGRMSGVVLIGLPFVIFLLLSVVSPGYTATLTGTGTGRLILLAALSLIGIGGLWLRSTVKVRF